MAKNQKQHNKIRNNDNKKLIGITIIIIIIITNGRTNHELPRPIEVEDRRREAEPIEVEERRRAARPIEVEQTDNIRTNKA